MIKNYIYLRWGILVIVENSFAMGYITYSCKLISGFKIEHYIGVSLNYLEAIVPVSYPSIGAPLVARQHASAILRDGGAGCVTTPISELLAHELVRGRGYAGILPPETRGGARRGRRALSSKVVFEVKKVEEIN